MGKDFLAEEYDFFEKENPVLSVDIRQSRNDEYAVKQKFAKVLQMMTFPILDAALETFDSLIIFRPTLHFIYLIHTSSGSFGACLQLQEMRVSCS